MNRRQRQLTQRPAQQGGSHPRGNQRDDTSVFQRVQILHDFSKKRREEQAIPHQNPDVVEPQNLQHDEASTEFQYLGWVGRWIKCRMDSFSVRWRNTNGHCPSLSILRSRTGLLRSSFQSPWITAPQCTIPFTTSRIDRNAECL